MSPAAKFVMQGVAALDDGMSKAAVCRNFGVKRTTLIETLARIDTAPSSGASSP